MRQGAFLNVRINVKGLKDRAMAEKLIAEAQEIDEAAAAIESEIIDRVVNQLGM